jgi:hypothetical protein
MKELWRKEKKKGVITNSKMTVISVFYFFFLVDGAVHYLSLLGTYLSGLSAN